MSSRTIQSIETKAAESELSASSSSSSSVALKAAINSAELYMQALRLSNDPRERTRLDTKCKEMLARAESIKAKRDGTPAKPQSKPAKRAEMSQPVSTRKLTTRENIILLEGSKLNGSVFKPWTQIPSPAEFELRAGEELYSEPHLSLSEDQLRSFSGWKRPTEALRSIKMTANGDVLPTVPIMALPGKIDLVQDMASDCSVVASLCAGTTRAEKGHPRIMSEIVYPYDYEGDHIKISPNGKYVLRLYFNGCWRRVEIDDLLPTSKSSRVLHVVDRSHPGLLWPALIEKAYLKVRGGYDFPGSNSGTDLEVLTGWLPQQVFLHDEDVDPNTLWTELFDAYERGNVLLTIGTGKLPRREQKQLGLAAEHDYAILDMKMHDDIREMLIKNPWSDGDVWKGAVRRRPNPNHEHEEPASSAQESLDEMLPGTFWMEFNSVFQYFENMYINWNPGLFQHRQDMHFNWNIAEEPFVPNVFSDHPQFLIRAQQADEIWLLVNRHLRTGDYTHANSGKNGYISLYLYDKNGFQVLSTEGAKIRGPFVDSPNTLLRFKASAHKAYTAVLVAQDLLPGKHSFTLSVISRSVTRLETAPSLYEHQSSLSAAWTRSTSGGNSDSPRYLENPQFYMTIVSPDSSVAVALQLSSDPAHSLDQTNIHVKLLLLYSPVQGLRSASDSRAHRINKLRSRDIVATSGDYRRGSAVIETVLGSGTYTLICSTFDEDQPAKFSLSLYTSSPANPQLRAVSSESSGRLCIVSSPAVFKSGNTRLIAALSLPRFSRAIFKGHVRRPETVKSNRSSSLFKISVEQGQGPYRIEVGTSASHDTELWNTIHSLRIEDTNLDPKMQTAGGLWLVLERPSQAASEEHSIPLEVEILAEERIKIGEWQAANGREIL